MFIGFDECPNWYFLDLEIPAGADLKDMCQGV